MDPYEQGKDAGYQEGHADGVGETHEEWGRALEEVGQLLAAYGLAEGHFAPEQPNDLPAIADRLALDLPHRLGQATSPERIPDRFRGEIERMPRDAWRSLYQASAYRYASEAAMNRGRVSITTEGELAQLATIGTALGVHPEEITRLTELAMRQVAA